MIVEWRDEDELWDFQVPRLRGWWRRLEAVYPEGLPDSFGLFAKEVHWLERKVGKPSRAAMRPKQIEFGLECIQRGVSWHICFGHKGEVLFFRDLAFLAPVVPKFWAPL